MSANTDRRVSRMLTAALHSPNFGVRLLHQSAAPERAEVVRRWSQHALSAADLSAPDSSAADPSAPDPSAPDSSETGPIAARGRARALQAIPSVAAPSMAAPLRAAPASTVPGPGLHKCAGPRATSQSHDMAVQLAAFARSIRRVGPEVA